MATATLTEVTASPAPEPYKLELMASHGNVFRDVLKTPPRDCDVSEIPIIDLATLSGSEEERIALADAFRAAAENNGFFYIKNHGIPEAKIQASFKQARAFFAQPVEQKALVSRNKSAHHNGWSERHATKISPTEKVDHKEGFGWRYHPKYDPMHGDFDPVPEEVKPWIRGEDFVWEMTSNLPGFKEEVLAY